MNLLRRNSPATPELVKTGAAIRKQTCIVTLAGGVGSRLGYDGPKGTFEIGGQSLFERQTAKILDLPWVIMVSPKTKDCTIAHIQQRVLKHIPTVYLIEQEEIEALSLEHEALYNNDKPVLVPNGNGSIFKALQAPAHTKITEAGVAQESSSILAVLASLSITYINIISVDNVLVQIADPLMLGYLHQDNLEVVSAAVPIPKGAQMGVFISTEHNIRIQEYIDKRESEVLKTEEGVELGNIANHIATLSFVQHIDTSQLKYHEAIKKIPHTKDPNPSSPNAIKRELFIFDGFNLSSKHGVVECPSSAYEGLKNKEGERESINSCIQALAQQSQPVQ